MFVNLENCTIWQIKRGKKGNFGLSLKTFCLTPSLVQKKLKNYQNLRGQASLTILYFSIMLMHKKMTKREFQISIVQRSSCWATNRSILIGLRYDCKAVNVFIAETRKHVPQIQVSGERRRRGRNKRVAQRFLKEHKYDHMMGIISMINMII